MFEKVSEKLSGAITEAVSRTYDKIAPDKEIILESARKHYHLDLTTWQDFQQGTKIDLMDEIANGYIQQSKIKVASIGGACGLGGLVFVIPDAIQFLCFTLEMVTKIAASYGFDPNPNYSEGKVKCIVLQAYLNGNIGHTVIDGVEKIGISAATKFLKTVAMRKNFLIKLIVHIGKALGFRITRQVLLKAVPGIAAVGGAGANWLLAQKIAKIAQAEFREFRLDLRSGKYKNDPDFDDFG